MADFSTELHDQCVGLNATAEIHLDFARDAATFYSALAAAERDHAATLRALLSKAHARRNKIASALVVGTSPAKSFQDGQARHTLEGSWSAILAAQEERAQSITDWASQLGRVSQNILRIEASSNTALKKQHAFYNKLLAARDQAEADRAKLKAKYDAACEALEQARQRKDTAKDEDKSERAFRKAEAAMQVAKNTYLVSVHTANASKRHFYQRDLPQMHAVYQLMWTVLVHALARVLQQSCGATQKHIDHCTSINAKVLQGVQNVDVEQDQAVYVAYNARPFFEPPDSAFEACSLWHDDERLLLDGDAKLYLQSLLAASQKELDAPTALETKQREADSLRAATLESDSNPGQGDAQDSLSKMLDAMHSATSCQLQRDAWDVEADVAASALGDDIGAQRPHQFKASSFAKPAPCAVCGQSIWGLGKPGLSCKCGVNVHTKCQATVEANCPKSRAVAGRRRAGSNATTASSILASPTVGSFRSPRNSGITAEPPALSPPVTLPSLGRSVLAYDFEASTELEITVQAGDSVEVLQQDQEGWTKVRRQDGASGLVPTSYMQDAGAPAASQAAEEWLSVLADYASAGEGELDITTAEQVRVLRQEEGGWTRVEKRDGTQGLVPGWAVG